MALIPKPREDEVREVGEGDVLSMIVSMSTATDYASNISILVRLANKTPHMTDCQGTTR
jgi:hypothetical protein